MSLVSKEKNIIDSLQLYAHGYYEDMEGDVFFYNKNGDEVGNSNEKEKIIDFVKKHTTVSIVENWNNTGRTWINITVDFKDNPLFVSSTDQFYFDVFIWNCYYVLFYRQILYP